MDSLPAWLLFVLCVAFLMLAVEAGYRLGEASLRQRRKESDAPVGAIAGALLALSAFILAFTFSMASNRYDTRKELVLQAANAVDTAYLRTNFLPEDERDEAQALLREYTDAAVFIAAGRDTPAINAAIIDLARIENRLWQVALINANRDATESTAPLYIESLNQLFNLRALRVSIGLEMQIPTTIWFVLSLLSALSMMGVGYQTALQRSVRSWSNLILTSAISVLITLIVLLDRPYSPLLPISQQPILNARAAMETTSPAP